MACKWTGFFASLPVMKFFKFKLAGAALTAGCLAVAQTQRAYSQDSPPEKSQALLQTVEQGELDRRIALKKTEIDRLKEDLEKSKKDIDALQKSLTATTSLISENTGNLSQLAEEEKGLKDTLELTELRIDAEKDKSEGLKALSAAQNRELDAITQRMAETYARSSVREAEVQLLTQGKPVPGEDSDEKAEPELHKLRKTLAENELKTVTAENAAHEAMKAASTRLDLADAAAARAKRKLDDMTKGVPEPVAEKADKSAPVSTPAPKHASTPAAAPSQTPDSKDATPEP